MVLPELVEAGGLDEHAGVRTREARNSENANDCSGNKHVRVVQGYRNLVEVTVFIPADEHDVETFFQYQPTTRARI